MHLYFLSAIVLIDIYNFNKSLCAHLEYISVQINHEPWCPSYMSATVQVWWAWVSKWVDRRQ